MPATLSILNETIRNVTCGTAAHPKSTGDTTGSVGAEFEAIYEVAIAGTNTDGDPIISWNGRTLLFNPALWLPNGDIREPLITQGWAVTFPDDGALIPANTFPMSLVGQSTQEPNNRNLQCDAIGHNTDEFTVFIRFRFRCTMDIEGYCTGAPLSNKYRLMKTRRLSGLPFQNNQPCVYNLADIRVLKACITATGDFPPKREKVQMKMQARWYHSNLAGNTASPEFGVCTPSILNADDGTPMSGLSEFVDQTIVFDWAYGTHAPARMIGPDFVCELLVLDITESANNGGTYLDQYQAVIGFTDVQDLGTGYQAFFSVGAGFFITGRQYMVIMIVPCEDGVTYITNSYYLISAANVLPVPIELDITGEITDFNVEPGTDNVISTVVDRVNCRTSINAVQYDLDAADTVWGAGNLASTLKSISITIETLDGIQYTETVEKVGTTWQDSSTGRRTGFTITEGPEFLADYVLHLAFLNYAGLPDWGDTSVQVHWAFNFFYPSRDWSVQYKRSQRVMVKDFQNFSKVITAINLLNFDTGQPLTNLCDCDLAIVEVLLDPTLAAGNTWNLRAYAGRQPYGYVPNGNGATTHEETGYDSPVGILATRSTSMLSAVPAEFVANRAVFFLDLSLIQEGDTWRVYAIAQPTEVDFES